MFPLRRLKAIANGQRIHRILLQPATQIRQERHAVTDRLQTAAETKAGGGPPLTLGRCAEVDGYLARQGDIKRGDQILDAFTA